VATPDEIRAAIRRIFVARGIDPDIAERVIKQESSFNPAARNINPKEESYGLAQLNVKGGEGAEARRRGIEPSDPSQWQRHLEYMADRVKKVGWKPWYGARDVGISQWQGVGGRTAAPAQPSPATVKNIAELQAKLLERYPELKVTSGYRDPAHNARVGGARNSQHTHGRAIDLSLKGIEEARQREIVDYARSLGARGIGYYPSNQSVHFDVRTGAPAAWGGNYSRTSLPQTPGWFQAIAKQHLQGGGGAPAVASTPLPTQAAVASTGTPTTGVLADQPDPFKQLAAQMQIQQAQQQAQQAQQAAQVAQQQAAMAEAPQPAPPPTPEPAGPLVDYSSLLMPRLRRGLLSGDYDMGLLGVA
jgi:Peptidase M15/Transglycosylase SLT domain